MGSTILVIGGQSLIGAAVRKRCEVEGVPVVATSRRSSMVQDGNIYLDLAEPSSFTNIPDRITHAVLCASEANLAVCRTEREATDRVNVEMTKLLIRELSEKGVHVTFLSTNLVFDGRKPACKEYCAVNPVEPYGTQKSQVEKYLCEIGPHAVCRLGKVVHQSLPILVEWQEKLVSGGFVEPFTDYFMSPVSLRFVEEVLWKVLRIRKSGIVHASSYDKVSYAAFCYAWAIRAGFDHNKVRGVTSASKGVHFFHNPRYTSLADSGALASLGLRQPSWMESVDTLTQG
ncbi:MAG: sugar nucleotide-binding protein [Parvibaculum sp.]